MPTQQRNLPTLTLYSSNTEACFEIGRQLYMGEEFQFSITGDAVAITKYDDGSGIIASRVNDIGKSKLMSAFEVVAAFCCDYFKVERRS